MVLWLCPMKEEYVSIQQTVISFSFDNRRLLEGTSFLFHIFFWTQSPRCHSSFSLFFCLILLSQAAFEKSKITWSCLVFIFLNLQKPTLTHACWIKLLSFVFWIQQRRVVSGWRLRITDLMKKNARLIRKEYRNSGSTTFPSFWILNFYYSSIFLFKSWVFFISVIAVSFYLHSL